MRPVRFCVVALSFHKYVYGVVPPVTLSVISPSLPPLHFTCVDVAVITIVAGSVIVVVLVFVQPLLSVTVTV